ncbi:hypothetical protein LMG7974_00716 [Campylobacter majalis]|uniref:Cytokinin riboside 5'-monophosphate phosphoribohydrolase n=1 Tax=Campylobacter majalis TaxID=2790656 RepID=A0ABM8Q4M1_9BACT|nr:TIGR00730 family Rossman fold protein [Campylobacter majalis]CAD7287828.1 hypothetical protein LMG7974_00716 [Campylobacter majalis]
MKFLDEFVAYKNGLNLDSKCVTFFGSARFKDDNEYCLAAHNLAYRLSENGISIITGGGDGIMKAANKGAFISGKSQSVGFNIQLPFEQNSNSFLTNSFLFSNFFPRKYALIQSSSAFVVFPGGYGTLDELFEVLTLSQTGMNKFKIYLYSSKFWSGLDDFIKTTLLNEQTIDDQSLKVYEITDDIDKIVNEIIML